VIEEKLGIDGGFLSLAVFVGQHGMNGLLETTDVELKVVVIVVVIVVVVVVMVVVVVVEEVVVVVVVVVVGMVDALQIRPQMTCIVMAQMVVIIVVDGISFYCFG